MADYTKAELDEAHQALTSTLQKCEKVQESSKLGASQRTLLERRIKALRISLALIEEKLEGISNADNGIVAMAGQLHALIEQAVIPLRGEVDAVIRQSVVDDVRVERLLDSLLNYAGHSEEALALFKRLGRYYYNQNPELVASYVMTYRNLYDSDDENENEIFQ